VWITNKSSSTTDTRNILALTDLGEGKGPDNEPNYIGPDNFIAPSATLNGPVSNDQNALYNMIVNQFDAIRSFNQISSTLVPLENTAQFIGGKDFEKIENARRLTESEYKLNEDLGYISLNAALRSDGLAVAYVYNTVKTYRVG
jgi:cell surface protein SprA